MVGVMDMTRAMVLLLALAPVVLFAQGPPADELATLIKNLSSSSFKVRQAAVGALKERPDAAPDLQKALKSPDPEVARRAAEILAHFDRKPVRDLESAVNNGQVERFVELMLDWPDGKYDVEAWDLVSAFADKLHKAHQKAGGARFYLATEEITPFLKGRTIPLRIREKRITESASGKEDLERKSRAVYLCADEVVLRYRLAEKAPAYHWLYNDMGIGAIITKRSAFIDLGSFTQVVFSSGDVELGGGGGYVLVVSAGDVVLNSDIAWSLVIAKGNIIVKNRDFERTRLIAGKKVITKDALDKSVIVSENDQNPLGFIRWADAAKDKTPVKAK